MFYRADQHEHNRLLADDHNDLQGVIAAAARMIETDLIAPSGNFTAGASPVAATHLIH
jgi:hypothetical protein